ncbi:MAG: DUF2066 domain-containing protein [Aestuariivirga sp.]|nr:DUF2066 domain-containing protein [Aestuariivirga sp.]
MIRIISISCLALFAVLLVWVVVGRDNSPGFAGNIYQTRAIVTGEREETRLPVLGQCLRDVLKKVSGDPAIDRDPRVEAFAGQAQAYIKSFSYRDRMEGIPIHDEQGTRDRPYDLTVDFHPEKIDELLQVLGQKPWTARRPTIVVLLAVKCEARSYLLTGDADEGFDQRESFMSAAWLTGMPMTLPSTAAFDEVGMTAEKLTTANLGELTRIARASGGGIVLVGSIAWNKGMLGWKGDWQLYSDDGPHHWQIRNVNFDGAFRSAMRGAAQVLSGNGEPQDEVQ